MNATKLSHHLSKIIFVKAQFTEDSRPAPFRLIGIESFGLWLAPVEPPGRLAAEQPSPSPPLPQLALVPFAQIEYITFDGPDLAGARADSRTQEAAPEKKAEKYDERHSQSKRRR